MVEDIPPSVDAARRFGGIARLYGAQALNRLAQAHVCVIGVGGVGSWVVEALARSGVGRLTLIDLDHVAESNINRQAQALQTTLGQAKTLALAERIAAIHPLCRVDAIEAFVSADNPGALIPRCPVVIDAIDALRAKAALIAHCRKHDQAIVTTGGAGGRTDPTLIRIDDLARTSRDPLAAKLRAALRREHGFPRDSRQPFGVSCIYSLEVQRSPIIGGETGVTAPQGLSCAGYGSSVCVTAAFGLAAASRALEMLTT